VEGHDDGSPAMLPWDGDNGDRALADKSVATCNVVSVECRVSHPHIPRRYLAVLTLSKERS
jgi:hypothetical protein